MIDDVKTPEKVAAEAIEAGPPTDDDLAIKYGWPDADVEVEPGTAPPVVAGLDKLLEQHRKEDDDGA